jgi:hypothetical protein
MLDSTCRHLQALAAAAGQHYMRVHACSCLFSFAAAAAAAPLTPVTLDCSNRSYTTAATADPAACAAAAAAAGAPRDSGVGQPELPLDQQEEEAAQGGAGQQADPVQPLRSSTTRQVRHYNKCLSFSSHVLFCLEFCRFFAALLSCVQAAKLVCLHSSSCLLCGYCVDVQL